MKKDTLSKRQNDIIIFIKRYIAMNDKSPSIREIANGVHLNSPATVYQHIQNLIQKGYLKKDTNNNNTLLLLVPNEFASSNDQIIAIPLLPNQNIEDFNQEFLCPKKTFKISSWMTPNTTSVFVTKITDNSLIDINIIKNDFIIIEKTNNISSKKDIVVFLKDKKLLIKKSPSSLYYGKIIGRIIRVYREY